jgi:hypothetical protein
MRCLICMTCTSAVFANPSSIDADLPGRAAIVCQDLDDLQVDCENQPSVSYCGRFRCVPDWTHLRCNSISTSWRLFEVIHSERIDLGEIPPEKTSCEFRRNSVVTDV